jgi:hypothetical protein
VASTHRHVAPGRYYRIGAGAVGPTDGAVAGTTATQAPPAASSGATSPIDIAGAWTGFLGGAMSSAQVALGAALVIVAFVVLVAQTSGGAAACRCVAGGARRAARLIPGVGALA